jgi:hypothetical protein
MAVDFANAIRLLESYGVIDFLLPFFLIFTVLYAVLKRVKVLGDNDRFAIIVALILAILVVVPHVTGNYPAGFDPIDVLNEVLPSVALVVLAIIMLFIMVGTFSERDNLFFPNWLTNVVSFIAVGFLVYVFGTSLGWWTSPGTFSLFSWWSDDLTSLLVILVVGGLVIKLITGDSTTTKTAEEKLKAAQGTFDAIKTFFGGNPPPPRTP